MKNVPDKSCRENQNTHFVFENSLVVIHEAFAAKQQVLLYVQSIFAYRGNSAMLVDRICTAECKLSFRIYIYIK